MPWPSPTSVPYFLQVEGLVIGPLVEALAVLPPKLAQLHLLLQRLGHDEDLLLGVLLDPTGEDGVAGVQAHKVSQLVGTLGHPSAQTHGLVDVPEGGITTVRHQAGLAEVGDQQPVDNEPWGILALHTFLHHHLGQPGEGVERAVRGLGGLDDLHQGQHHDGVEEVDSSKAVRAAGHLAQLRDGKGRGVGAQNGLLVQDLVQLVVQGALDVHVFHNGLNHNLAVLHRVQVSGHGNAGEAVLQSLLGSGGLHLALLHLEGEDLLVHVGHGLHGVVKVLLLDIHHRDVEPVHRSSLGNAVTHQTSSQHANFGEPGHRDGGLGLCAVVAASKGRQRIHGPERHFA
eukprot:RCo039228